jgi:hypothetical protein
MKFGIWDFNKNSSKKKDFLLLEVWKKFMKFDIWDFNKNSLKKIEFSFIRSVKEIYKII